MKISELRPNVSNGAGIEVCPDCSVRCLSCGATWEPKTKKNGDLRAGWYLCWEGCNWGRLFPDPMTVFSETRRDQSTDRIDPVGVVGPFGST